MIEDISNEMQRSRRYRADLEISQSVIDQLEDAIAVFGQSGQLMWCNTAYSRLWNHDPSVTLDDVNIRSATQKWKTLTAPTTLWHELDEYIHTIGLRKPWSKDVRLNDGRLMSCAISPVAAGSTMVMFKSATSQTIEKPLPLPVSTADKATAAR